MLLTAKCYCFSDYIEMNQNECVLSVQLFLFNNIIHEL